MAKQGLWVAVAGETEVASGATLRGRRRLADGVSGPARSVQAPPAEAQGAETLRDLLELYRGDIRRFAASRLGDGVDAGEIAQQTLFQALLNLAAFRGGNPRGWLLAIARRLIIDRCREQGRSRSVAIDEDFVESEGSTLRTPHDRVQAICQARERIRHCLDCMTTLPSPRQQVAVLLADVHGYTDPEAAARMGTNVSCFKSLLRKARRRLHAAAGHQCSLVAKAGIGHACRGFAGNPAGSGRMRPGDGARRGGLDDVALAGLQRELLGALDLDDSWRRPKADEKNPGRGHRRQGGTLAPSIPRPSSRLGHWHGETKALPDVRT